MKINQKQSDLLSVKDLQAYAVLKQIEIAATPQEEQETFEPESDDQQAFRERCARPGGLTDDEKLYFRAKGFPVAD
jgi:hypothetical protein